MVDEHPEVIPRTVFRMCHEDDKSVVLERKLIGRKGSWYEYERGDGSIVKENGQYWHDTIMGALQAEAMNIMHRFRVPHVFGEQKTLEQMFRVIDEAARVGQEIGGLEELKKQVDAAVSS